MNIIAVDIGNSTISVALFSNSQEEDRATFDGFNESKLKKHFKTIWKKLPVAALSTEKKREDVIVVSSVKPQWTTQLKTLIKDTLDEKIMIIGEDIPLPMPVWTDEPNSVGTDRIMAAFACYSVVEQAVVIIDVGTALTIDVVDDNGIFQGGVICPGFAIAAKALSENTALLPEIKISKPSEAIGKNTSDSINAGLYYGAIGTIQEVITRFSEKINKWPQTIMTGSGAAIIKDDCDFVDSLVAGLVTKGIALTYRKYTEEMN